MVQHFRKPNAPRDAWSVEHGVYPVVCGTRGVDRLASTDEVVIVSCGRCRKKLEGGVRYYDPTHGTCLIKIRRLALPGLPTLLLSCRIGEHAQCPMTRSGQYLFTCCCACHAEAK